ncbi:MAG: SufE family protein [Verrucomicrobiales bacterium]|nr:SufE family protein [Verrucomicrobiales bacterium]MCP5556266.1 SufE family protein [Verrucomicrobiaceae bacterium]
MTLAEKQNELIDDLNFIDDPQERLSVVVSRGAKHQLEPQQKTEENLVRGCVSRVWVIGTAQGEGLVFRCDAESPMVKGLAALLCDLYSGASPEDVVAVEPRLWSGCGFDKMLSPTRLNGLAALRAKIQTIAAAK